mgnify:FL=1|tara:strand:+ start:244 stop:456 length:213 start_codon:yes stop_codon:yes gene_type:complete
MSKSKTMVSKVKRFNSDSARKKAKSCKLPLKRIPSKRNKVTTKDVEKACKKLKRKGTKRKGSKRKGTKKK